MRRVFNNTTKEAIKALITKFSIHGKYDVAKKLEEYVDTFLSSFDFEQHPQYDLQWCLLTLLLELSKETSKSNLECLKLTRGESIFNATGENESEATEEIDWAQYLRDGQEHFFDDYKSDSESEWSDNDEDVTDISTQLQISTNLKDSDKTMCISVTAKRELSTLSVALTEELKSRNWLASNVQNTWWNELEWRKYPVKTQFCDAHLCEIWRKATETDYGTFGTLSEYSVCRELLWMFYTPMCMVVFQQNDETDFFIRPNISIPSLTTVNESLTLLSLSTLLKKRLYNIKILYEVHQKVIHDWKVQPNWICASKLLSSLYFEIQKSHNRRRSNICASLYLCSLSVYLNIIDTWLGEGRFEDWREEFIIVRFLNDSSLENNEHYKAFSLRPLDDLCLADPIMQILIKKMQRMGQSVELLVSLDRITDIWKINNENGSIKLEKISDYILPFRKILETILAEILVSRYNSASKLVKNIMLEEYKLESHLILMRSVYMMEAGHIMSKFYQKLFQEIESNQMWSNSYYLSCILEEILSQQWPDSSSRWSIAARSIYTNQVLIAIDNITLQYAIWKEQNQE
nr:uncharacterized protein LOC117228903 [Megalopta genalis]